MALSSPKVTVSAASARFSTLPYSLSDDYRKKLGELIELDDRQKKGIKAWLKERIREWREDTQDLHQRLLDDNDLVEGQTWETDFPWEGASNVHIPVTEMYMEVYKSVEKRSILGADLIWYGESDVDELKDSLADIDEMLNYKARNEWNIESCISNVFWTTNRDGLGIIKAIWSEEYEPARDILLITSEADFIKEFPGPEESGLSEDEYLEFLLAASEATEEMPLEIPITFEKQTYYGVKGSVVELANFPIFPAWAPDINHELCRGYGERYFGRGGMIRKKKTDGVWYKDACNAVLKKKGKNSSITEFEQAQDDIDGISRTNVDDNYELFEIVAKGRLNGNDDEDEEKFLFTYSEEHDELLQAIYYPYRIDYMALFRINERPNRLIGRSIPAKTRDINDEIDTQHNQRINTRTIGTVPSFKAANSAKKSFDPKAQENKWRPGVIFWLDNFDHFEQFKVQPTDLGESLQEENNDFKILDQYLGSAVALLSGGAAPSDPNAPGNKTAMMIQQSNLRMDDPLYDLRSGVSKLGDICLSHLYQFGPPIIEFQSEVGSQNGRTMTETKSIHKKFLRTGIRMKMQGITVTQNPEAEMAKELQIHQTLMMEPAYAQNAKLRIGGLSDALRAGRIQGRRRKLPTPQEIEQMEIDLRKKAMMQMAAEQQAAQEQAAAAELKKREATARQSLQTRDLARRLAEENMAEAVGSVNGVAQ